MQHFKMLALSLSVGLAALPAATHARLSGPEKAAFYFYHGYLNDMMDHDTIVNTYVSQPLLNSIDTSLQCNYGQSDGDEKVCSATCEGNKCLYGEVWVETELDYFTKAQDPYPDWSKFIDTTLISRNDTTALVAVTLGRIEIEKASYTVTLIKDGAADEDNWKIWQVTR